MPFLVFVVLWVILSLVAAPAIGALFVPRHRREDRGDGMDRHMRVKEPIARGKESPRRGGEGQEE